MLDETDIKGGQDKGFTERMTIIKKQITEVWVKKWVDYSTKYGLAYYLSNDATGVFFNDSSKLIMDPNLVHLNYLERNQ